MKIIGPWRVEWRMLARMRKGAVTQARAPAAVPDFQKNRGVDSPAAKAQVGDIFWIAEDAVCYYSKDHHYRSQLYYCAEAGNSTPPDPSRPLKYRHMRSYDIIRIGSHKMRKGESCRSLQITAHRIERLGELKSADAECCGVEMEMFGGRPHYHLNDRFDGITPQESFRKFYRFCHGCSEDSDPLVVAITFRIIEGRADEIMKRVRAGQGYARVAQEALGAG